MNLPNPEWYISYFPYSILFQVCLNFPFSLFPNNSGSKYLRQSQTPHLVNALLQGLLDQFDVIWSIVPTCCIGYTHLWLYPDINMIRGIMDNEKAMHWTRTSCNRWNRGHLLNDSMVPAMATAGITKGMTWIHKTNNDLYYLSWTLQTSSKSVSFSLNNLKLFNIIFWINEKSFNAIT